MLGGDTARYDSGIYAVFSEQSTFSITRLSRCSGQASEAVSAKTQMTMKDAPELSRLPQADRPMIWIRPPRSRRPKVRIQEKRPIGSPQMASPLAWAGVLSSQPCPDPCGGYGW